MIAAAERDILEAAASAEGLIAVDDDDDPVGLAVLHEVHLVGLGAQRGGRGRGATVKIVVFSHLSIISFSILNDPTVISSVRSVSANLSRSRQKKIHILSFSSLLSCDKNRVSFLREVRTCVLKIERLSMRPRKEEESGLE